MASWKDFTGRSLIKGAYQQSVAASLLKNELGGKSNGYTLENAVSGKSGWSFGGEQLDLSKRSDGVLLMKDIIVHQYGINYWNSVATGLQKANNLTSVSSTDRAKIDAALSSTYGKAKINENFVQEINRLTNKIDLVEKELQKINPDIKLTDGEKLMLIDFDNQYGLSLKNTVSGSMLKKMQDYIGQTGHLTLESLVLLFQTTEQYQNDTTGAQENRINETYKAAQKLDSQNLSLLDTIQNLIDDPSGAENVSRTLANQSVSFAANGDIPYSGVNDITKTLTDTIRSNYGENMSLVSDTEGNNYLMDKSTGEIFATVSVGEGVVSLIGLGDKANISVDSQGGATVTNAMTDNNGTYTIVHQTLNSAGTITGVTVNGTDANGNDYTEEYGNNGTLLSRTTSEYDGDNVKTTYETYDANGKVITKDMSFRDESDNYAFNIVSDSNTLLNNLFDAEYQLTKLYNAGNLGSSFYDYFTQFTADYLVSAPIIDVPNINDGFDGLSLNPIGAFYESVTPANDPALSIADKTFVLLDSANKGITSSALASKDTNGDGKLTGTELTGLNMWRDLNENGVADTGEITTLASQNITTLRSEDYGMHTRGNSVVAAAALIAPTKVDKTLAIPTKINKVLAVPASNFRTLRDTDNVYYWASGGTINWANNQNFKKEKKAA